MCMSVSKDRRDYCFMKMSLVKSYFVAREKEEWVWVKQEKFKDPKESE